jgi:hypothetical protein
MALLEQGAVDLNNKNVASALRQSVMEFRAQESEMPLAWVQYVITELNRGNQNKCMLLLALVNTSSSSGRLLQVCMTLESSEVWLPTQLTL